MWMMVIPYVDGLRVKKFAFKMQLKEMNPWPK